MKNLVYALIFTLSTTAQAQVIGSKPERINPAVIDQVIRLVNKSENGSEKRVQVISTNNGMSTDLSPRGSAYLTYSSTAEMGNIFAVFEITNEVYGDISAIRTAPGIYQVTVLQFRDQIGYARVTYEVNSVQMFIDENNMRKKCGGDFCDGNLKSTITIKEISVVPVPY